MILYEILVNLDLTVGWLFLTKLDLFIDMIFISKTNSINIFLPKILLEAIILGLKNIGLMAQINFAGKIRLWVKRLG